MSTVFQADDCSVQSLRGSKVVVVMPQSRQSLERQIKIAEETLAQRASKLAANIVQKTDPLWRKYNANCQALQKRLRAVAATEANNAEIERMKAEKLAAE